MALCSAGILLALGLFWFVGAVAVPYCRVRSLATGEVSKFKRYLLW
jgi:hypothetical protein